MTDKQGKILEGIATALTISGLWMISNSLISGWFLALAGNILWMIWGIEKDAKYLIFLNFILALIAINGVL